METIMNSVKSWIEEIIQETVDKLVEKKEEEADAVLLNRDEVTYMLGLSGKCFDKHYRHLEGFPRELPGKRWSKLAIIEWLKKQD